MAARALTSPAGPARGRRAGAGARTPTFALVALALLAGCGEDAPAGGRIELDLSGPGWTLWLDDEAAWADDLLHPPGVDVATLPARPPTGGFDVLAREGRAVTVPSTVETWTWDERGDHRGISWWRRTFTLPEAAAGRRVVLAFSAVRLRAEVFLDGTLVGYDAVGSTPFTVDVTSHARPGAEHELAVRVTDPGGNLDWIDHTAHRWGDQPIPPSHGFGGVTGPVRVLVTDPVRTVDVFVANTPAITDVDVEVTVRNDAGAPARRDLVLSILDERDGALVHERAWPDLALPPGETVVSRSLSVPGAARWELDAPRLHRCRVRLAPPDGGDGARPDAVADETSVRFGFRWFAPEGIGEDAVFRLNGRRVVLASAISWGFWPVTGMVPPDGLARRQVEAARALGLNMLNHHRGLAAPGLLDAHDELGLLAHEEPGGYWSRGGDALTFALAREKWLRMVRRDRNHPSLVILNMINEATVDPDARMLADLREAQALDPTRTITFTSAWAERYGADGRTHVRPGDPEVHVEGWHDWHDAAGPGVDRDRFYVAPDEYRRHVDDRARIVFLGEEGAIGAPPRLGAIAREVEARDAHGAPRGWDSGHWLARRDALAAFLARPGWRDAYPDVDVLTRALAGVAYDFHARALGNACLGDVVDGYVINGWEGQPFENHSGIVGPWRRPKGEVARLAPALAPVHLAVRVPERVHHASVDVGPGRRSGVRVRADVFLVDETERAGPHELLVRWLDPDGRELAREAREVEVAGGEVFGQLLGRLEWTRDAPPGRHRVVASLHAPGARARGEPPIVEGAEALALVRWRDVPIPTGGARLEGGERLGAYLSLVKETDVPRLAARRDGEASADGGTRGPGAAVPAADLVLRELGPRRWIAVADVDPEPRVLVPREALRAPDGSAPGLRAAYFPRADLSGTPVVRREVTLDLDAPPEGPVPGVGGLEYGVRWSGRLLPAESGPHRLAVTSAGGVRLWIEGRLVLDAWDEATPTTRVTPPVPLEAGAAVPLRLEHRHEGIHRRVRLEWSTPSASAPGRALARALLARAAEDGTSVLVLTHADRWARAFADAGGPGSRGTLPMGRYWMGGGFVGREHPVLEGLLGESGALDFAFGDLVHYGAVRDGLLLEDAETIVACVTSHAPRAGTALGVARHGRGRLVLCTLDLVTAIDSPPGPGGVARALLGNLLAWAAEAAR